MEIVKEPKKVTIDTELKNAIQTLVEEESQVIIHLHLHFTDFNTIRIWKSTFLLPHNNGKKIFLKPTNHHTNFKVPTLRGYPNCSTPKGR